ncbi:MAG: TIGR00341 family protein, partial [Muribaculaceae bacterium]|nr:TIGR00341 family protein [Muribaculaceae bacterium]
FANGEKHIAITLIGRTLPLDSLRLALDARLKFYGLSGTKLTFIQGGSDLNDDDKLAASGVGDIYRIAQSTITRQQTTIDSLRTLLDAGRQSVIDAPEVSPEIKVVFPKISKIGISTTVFAAPSGSAPADTATVAIIRTHGHFPASERKRLADYLEARLGYGKVSVVEME